MSTILETLQALQNSPVPNLLVIAGCIFIFLAFVGRFGAFVELPPQRQKMGGILGAVLLMIGIGLFVVPNSQLSSAPGVPDSTGNQPADTSAPAAPSREYRILVDEYHGFPLFDMTGIDGYNLRNQGFVFEPITTELSLGAMSEFDAVVIGFAYYEGGKARFSPEEIIAIREYIKQGKGVFLVGLGWVWVTYEKLPIEEYPLNLIAADTGMFFSGQTISSVNGVGYEEAPITFRRPFLANHPVTQNVNQIGASKTLPGSLVVDPPAAPLIWGDDNTNDSNGTQNPIMLAASTLGDGRIVCLQHGSYVAPFEDTYEDGDFPDN